MKIRYRALSLALGLVLCLSLFPVADAARTDCRRSVISGGVSHSLAVKDDGSVWAWGSNDAKQVAPSSDAQSITRPAKVSEVTAAVAVAAGSDFSAALLQDGSVTVWGGGSGVSTVPGLTGISSISAGQSTLLALKQDGTVWQWLFGSDAPVQVSELKNISAVSAGGGHYLALSHSGQVWAWGNNSSGQLGVGSSEGRIDMPQKVAALSDIISIAAGYSHSLAADSKGQVYAWGSNGSGQLGNNTTDNSSTPKAVLNVKNAMQVSAGNETSMVLASNNRLYTWGYGEYGQLGTDTISNSRKRPDTINNSFGTVVLIASGMNHNIMLNSTGAVYAWGRNRDFQLGTDKNTNGTTPQKISLSLKSDNTYTPSWYSVNVWDGASGWAVGELTSLYEAGIAPPSLWERYDQNITRAEFARLMVTVYEHVRKTTVTPSADKQFEDIKGHPLEEDILKAYQLGLLQGQSPSVFAPDNNITRQEATKPLCALLNKLRGTYIPTNVDRLPYYSDAAKIAGWAAPYVAFAHDQNIMQGSGDTFNPGGAVTREQALVIVSRLVERYGWA